MGLTGGRFAIRPRRIVVLSLCLTLFCLSYVAYAKPTIRPGSESYFRQVVPAEILPNCPWKLRGIQIEPSEVRYEFLDSSSTLTALVTLSDPSQCSHPAQGTSAAFCVSVASSTVEGVSASCSPGALEQVVRDGIVSNPDQFRWTELESQDRIGQPEGTGVAPGWVAAVLWGVLVLLAVGAGSVSGFGIWKRVYPRDLGILFIAAIGLGLRVSVGALPANIRLGYANPHQATPGRDAFHAVLSQFGTLTLESVSLGNAAVGALTIVVGAVLGRLLANIERDTY